MGLLCCAPAAVPYCHGHAAVLASSTCCCGTCGSWMLLSCCSHAPHVLQRDHGSSEWDLESRARAPPIPGWHLSYRPCTQPIARAKQFHMGPGPSASSPSHQLLVARMVAVRHALSSVTPFLQHIPNYKAALGENNSLAV